ncbi:hypothetical protein CLV24_11978 [Pontibacter ummariensis]|uniref:Uncharacterized protein n=1 Tax=Pontibacter ummariensis TaxID=1610492 RepID=A0A239IXZ4_9BACT|nr:hypothetical protein [Pontibacter ummariensis]PRY09027.1 hypothetical protein CLV24_11978 [Pontibacter ummariensis]SNS98646.1 hypothetical protein SAMN06296052_11978 [Pontibacter ummariensis]
MKKSSQTRELLKQLLKGNKPKLELAVVEFSDTRTWVIGEKMECLLKENVPAYIEQIRKDNPLRQVTLLLINREEFEAMTANLEKKY